MLSGVTAAFAAATPAESSEPSNSSNKVALRIASGLRATTSSASAGTAASMERPNAAPSLAKTRPGVTRFRIARSLPKSLDINE